MMQLGWDAYKPVWASNQMEDAVPPQYPPVDVTFHELLEHYHCLSNKMIMPTGCTVKQLEQLYPHVRASEEARAAAARDRTDRRLGDARTNTALQNAVALLLVLIPRLCACALSVGLIQAD